MPPVPTTPTNKGDDIVSFMEKLSEFLTPPTSNKRKVYFCLKQDRRGKIYSTWADREDILRNNAKQTGDRIVSKIEEAEVDCPPKGEKK